MELPLAKSSKLYIILNIAEQQIDLKARGLTLRTWGIEKIHLWGDLVPLEPIPLKRKSTFFPPEREEIKPGETKQEDSFEIEALELVDMPSTYTIILEGNVFLHIRPKSKGLRAFIENTGNRMRRQLFFPLMTASAALRKKTYTRLDIVLQDKEEAKAFYWAIYENMQFILLLPDFNDERLQLMSETER